MLIFVVDDEEFALKDIQDVISEAIDDARIMGFLHTEDAIEAVESGERPDLVFSDIVMPGLSGLEFAHRLKEYSPDTRVIFTTGYREYAVDAFKVKAYGYLMKPISVDQIKDEISQLPQSFWSKEEKLEVRCFGYFDVYFEGKPVVFKRKQSKELFAYLIDRNGAACSSGEIALALWEDEEVDERSEKNRIRVLINDLKNTLKQIGMADVLIRESRELAVRKELLDCDYYRMLGGDEDVTNSYQGEYMVQYGWAEVTNGRLSFIKESKPRFHNTSVLYYKETSVQ